MISRYEERGNLPSAFSAEVRQNFGWRKFFIFMEK
jgi:hypothetical protein